MTSTILSAAAKLGALGRCELFAGVPVETLSVLAEIMQTESLAAEAVLFEQGEPSDRVYVIVSGTLAVWVGDRPTPVRSLGPGQLVGEYGMFAGQVRTATVRAMEPAVLVSLDYGRFRSFLAQFPEASFALLRTAVQRLVEAEQL